MIKNDGNFGVASDMVLKNICQMLGHFFRPLAVQGADDGHLRLCRDVRATTEGQGGRHHRRHVRHRPPGTNTIKTIFLVIEVL